VAAGRLYGADRLLPRAPRRGPQSGLTRLLRGDVLAWTRTARAAELAVFPGLVSRTYYGHYRPGSAQRLPPMIPEEPQYRRVRETIVARARLLRSSLQLGGRS
jgi:hypothetical protein